jgi:Flp pilus assembly protein TadG
MKRFRANKRGQGTLEMSVVFVLSVLLIGGIVNIWLWLNNQIVTRQIAYNNSRVTAGTSADSYTLMWPVYTPPALTEDKVILK